MPIIAGAHSYFVLSPLKCEGKNSWHDLIPALAYYTIESRRSKYQNCINFNVLGKGITYDSGGLCLKKCKPMREYRGDLAGAAVIVGTFKAAASLGLPINLKG